ncbi:MAG: KGK domain-containing protein [Nostocaceae cyanobacterium]|nr:KGK domain-containing protein [Nostocaceae cyanobacterium]
MNDKFQKVECSDNDVISFPGDVTYKIRKFQDALYKCLKASIGEEIIIQLNYEGIDIDPHTLHPDGCWKAYKAIFNEGIDCEILNLGAKDWKNAKLKIAVNLEIYTEITPETTITQPESPLDELRRQISEAT